MAIDHAQNINTIRMLAADMVETANSGHPGLPLGAAPMAYALWTQHMRFNPAAPTWVNRDRFVLSAGHGSALLYAMLHLFGYPGMSIDQLKRFRQLDSITPGHPEYGLTPGVEVTTGPLGQGLSNAVGIALAERHLAARFNSDAHQVIDFHTYVIASDGDMMEGVASEACSLAGHLKLGRLIVLYDDNHISIDGSTDLAFTEDVPARFEAYGWHVAGVDDGNDIDAINSAIESAKSVTDRPSLIRVRTTIGYGAPEKAGTADSHGSPLGADELAGTKEFYGFDPAESFAVDDHVRTFFASFAERGAELQKAHEAVVEVWKAAGPDNTAMYEQWSTGSLPDGWQKSLPTFKPGQSIATRKASGEVLDAMAPAIPLLIGGSADLTPSNNTKFKSSQDLTPGNYGGRYIRYGVREHAMGAIMNGMAVTGLIPYGGTFLTFSDYMRPAIRLAALSHYGSIYVFTHDSIGLGEDGPTHQPVEHYAALRAIPNLLFIRPADAVETAAAWQMAIENRDRPTAIALTRQNLPVLEGSDAEKALRGGYMVHEIDPDKTDLDIVIVATGSEVHIAVEAAGLLQKNHSIGARVVSIPCLSVFMEQGDDYHNQLLPPTALSLVVEAGVIQGWEGIAMAFQGMHSFGASAPLADVMKHFGFTPEAIAEHAVDLLDEMRQMGQMLGDWLGEGEDD